MAEKDVHQKLQEQTTCAICLDTYMDPKVLQCDHVYCRECLKKLLLPNMSLACPNCRQVTFVPKNGVQDLKPAFPINNLIEFKGYLEKKAVNAPEIPHCQDHTDEELKLYCETCKKLICLNCAIKGAKHYECKYINYDQCKEEVTESLGPTKKNLSAVKEALKMIEASHEEVSGQYYVVEANIHDAINKLHKILEDRRSNLVTQLRQFTKRKLESLNTQRDHVTAILAKLQQCQVDVEEKLKTMSSHELFEAKGSIFDHIKSSNVAFQQVVLSPATTADITLITSPQDENLMANICQKYGVLSAMETQPDPSKIRANGSFLDTVMVGENLKCYFQAVNHWGEPCEVPELLFACELVSELKPTPNNNISPDHIKMSYYELDFSPALKGYHHLYIMISGKHIQGSPFTLLAKSAEAKNVAKLISTIPVDRPWGIAINHKREIVVSEHDKHRITVFNSSCVRKGSFGTYGSGESQFNHPRGVAVDEDDNILVADYKNNRIQKFTSDGEFLAAVGTNGNHPLQGPNGIATYKKKVYVIDENYSVQIFYSDLTFHVSFGGPGFEIGELTQSWGIGCDKYGDIYVPIRGQGRVQVFSPYGAFLREMGSFGSFTYFPFDVSFDNDVLYVTDRNKHNVSVFTLSGTLLGTFGDSDSLCYPRCLAVDSGVVYVCDNNNDRISIF